MIYPGSRITGITAPGTIRRFSPDGRYLAVFGHDQASLHFYTAHGHPLSRHPNSFEDFFTLKCTLRLPPTLNNSLLCKDFLLFTKNHLILASAAPSRQEGTRKSDLDNARSLKTFEHLDDVCFHLVGQTDFSIKNSLRFEGDYILLANHSGVSLLGDDYFLVTSIQHQCIIVYRIIGEKFVIFTKIGHFLGLPRLHPKRDEGMLHCGLWHKILCFCYKRSVNKSWFHGVSKSLANLVISKCQFIDVNRVLIRMVPIDFLSQRFAPSEQPLHYFLTIFSFRDNQIEEMFHYSKFMPWFLENDHLLRQSAAEVPDSNINSYSNCQETRNSLLKNFDSISETKRNGLQRRLFFSIPYSPQILSCSPFLSLEHFRYDEKYIGRETKWRSSPDHPIRFVHKREEYVTHTFVEHLGFSIEPWANQPIGASSTFKKYHSTCWHPGLPLVLISHQSALRSSTIDIYYH